MFLGWSIIIDMFRGSRRHLNLGIQIENSNWANLVFLADPQDVNSLADLPPTRKANTIQNTLWGPLRVFC